ncbi:MAG: hypothetical protein ACRC7S_18470 [Cetobacterium sp.]
MGLDMYLRKYGKDEKVLDCVSANDDCSICNGCIVEEVYWRKANHIHNWFVENVQNGVDDCGSYEVTIEKLTELRDICNQVINDNSLAGKLLPTTSGFFFGSDEYDEYYFDDTERTKTALDEVIKEYNNSKCKYVYHSSW